jgi:hypothetical protein
MVIHWTIDIPCVLDYVVTFYFFELWMLKFLYEVYIYRIYIYEVPIYITYG